MGRKKLYPKIKKTRVQFEFTGEVLKKLDALKAQTGATTRAEVIRRSLSLFFRVMENQCEGGKVGFEDVDGHVEWYRLL